MKFDGVSLLDSLEGKANEWLVVWPECSEFVSFSGPRGIRTPDQAIMSRLL